MVVTEIIQNMSQLFSSVLYFSESNGEPRTIQTKRLVLIQLLVEKANLIILTKPKSLDENEWEFDERPRERNKGYLIKRLKSWRTERRKRRERLVER